MEAVDKIIELALADPAFRKDLLSDPAEALRQRGIALEPAQIEMLQRIATEDVSVVSDEISQRLAKVSEVERSY
jgi:hypothetical protein